MHLLKECNNMWHVIKISMKIHVFKEEQKLSRSHYSSFSDRNERIVAAYQTSAYKMEQIADEFGLHYATVSRVVKKAEEN